MSAMSPPAELRQHVVVVGADSLAVRLVEELVRAGERLVVLAHGDVATAVVAELDRLGAQMIRTDHLEEVDLVTAAVERAKAAVILGDDDVLAVRVALAVEELAPDCRLVIEMANPALGEKLARCSGTPGSPASTPSCRLGMVTSSWAPRSPVRLGPRYASPECSGP